MNEERAWILLSLQLTGEATEEELNELNTLLQQHPELGLRMEIMKNIWRSKEQPVLTNTNHFDKHLQRLSNHLSEPALQFDNETAVDETPVVEMPVRSNRFKWVWVAAAAAVVLVILMFVMPTAKTKNNEALASNTVSTRPGSKSKVELPDGTQVWLNADSKLTYNQDFPGTTREVQLTGEAFFDVATAVSSRTGQKIPFIIHTNSIDVKVLGTAFNVRSYPSEKTTETALIRGVVEITLHNSPDKKILLKPNEKLVVSNDMATVTGNEAVKDSAEDTRPVMTLSKIRPFKGDSGSIYETMWVKNKLAFENETFDRMLAEMERWYNIKFVVKNDAYRDLHFTGAFENKTLAEVLEALSISRKFQYEIKGDQVIIW